MVQEIDFPVNYSTVELIQYALFLDTHSFDNY
jgi:hypothetical protein